MALPPMPIRSPVLAGGLLSRVWRDWWQAVVDVKANSAWAVRTVTDTTTEQSGDRLIRCDKASAMTVTLLAATGSGRTVTVANINTGAVTVDAAGSETIAGALTQTVTQHTSCTVVDAGTGAWVLV